MKSVVEIVKVKEAEEADLFKRPGVTGVDVGYKYVDGKRTDEICIRVMVADKKKDMAKDQMIPKTIQGIKTDVIQRNYFLQKASNRVKVQDVELMVDTGRYDPIKGGISIGPCRSVGGYIYAGTLGCVVKDNATGNTLLLSNFHVMCIDNGWHVGDEMCQPSRVDTGTCPADRIGTLLRAVLDSSTDAAVCTLAGRSSVCEIMDIGAVAGTATAALNMPVRKRGRTTGLTYGTVDSINLTVNVDYGDGLGVHTLTNQIGIIPDLAHNPKFGDHGDSGSVVVNNNREIIGLHFAGGDDGSGVANPIAAVLSDLNISICVPAAPKPIIKDIIDKHIHKEFIKDGKPEKLEVKELKDNKREKLERELIKRNPDVPKLIDTNLPVNPPELPVTPITPVTPIAPVTPNLPGMEQRLSQLEATLDQLSTFITTQMRPDMATGALVEETDMGNVDPSSMSQQLEKAASDALQAKTEYDAKVFENKQ